MKKLLFLLIFLPGIMMGQRNVKVWWFDAGLKVQYGATGLYNTAIVDDPNWNYEIGTGTSFGGKLGVNYDVHGITLDALFGSSAQPFDQAGDPNINDVKWKHTDIYLMYRNNKNLGYFELGPKYSLINSVTSTPTAGPETDISDQFSSSGLAGVLGFGVYLLGSDGAFSGILGFRLEYGFQDIVNDSGATLNAPLPETSFTYGDNYAASHPIFAGISFELNFGIGYFGRASCGGRSKFIRF